jgi:uncharacterized membrane protein YccC
MFLQSLSRLSARGTTGILVRIATTGTLAVESSQARSPWRQVTVHSARTAVAAMASLVVAKQFHLPEAYWASITTLVVTQSSLGAALSVSGERFMGTLLGATVGAIVATFVPTGMLVFSAGVFVLGFLTAVARGNRSAYRFAGVTFGIVLLVPRTGPPWHIALARFADVCIGLGVALMLTVFWRENEEVSRA